MGSKNITLKVEEELYDLYRRLCKEKGYVVSRQFEIFMEQHLKEHGIVTKNSNSLMKEKRL